MSQVLILFAIVFIISVVSSKLLNKLGVPTLLIFLVLGMLFGSDGPIGIQFDNFELAKNICSVGLIFIMFYGGFGTSWKTARPVAVPAVLMSTLGVVITAVVTGLFCHYFFGVGLLEGLVLGSVVSSTDAAAVFAILRSRKLNLKGGLAPLLEIESGSNDPVSYMLTIIMLTLLNTGKTDIVPMLIFKQLFFGIIIGALAGVLAALVLKNIAFEISGINTILVTGIAILSFALADILGGNGFLATYLTGIILGNSKIQDKKSLVHFFDGISWLMQIMLFFTLGLLSFPTSLPEILAYAVPLAIFIILVARPLATFCILSFFKVQLKEQFFVSAVGLRGAASIAFAMIASTGSTYITNDIFHIVFFVALFSVTVQGSALPFLAKKLGLIDNDTSVLKTFTDYSEDESTKVLELVITEAHTYCNKTIATAGISSDILVIMLKREGRSILPKGSTEIRQGDILVLLFRQEFYDSIHLN